MKILITIRRKVLTLLCIVILIGVAIVYWVQRNNISATVNSDAVFGIIRQSDAYNTFSGWDWFIDQETHLGMGVAKGGFLSEYGPKIHPIDPLNPEPWSKGEFFCDPDTIIVAKTKSKYEIAYGNYLSWNKDMYLREDNQFARVSFNYNNGLKRNLNPDILNKNDALKLDIREDHTMLAGKNWIQTNVEIINRYSEPTDVLYIYQDAAYMWLPDNNQDGVTPFSVKLGDSPTFSTEFQVNTTGIEGYVAGTVHNERNIFSGLYTDNPNALIGAVPNYVLFKVTGRVSLDNNDVDNFPKEIDEIISNMRNSINEPGQFKSRVIAFPIMNIEPGEKVIITFYRMGLQSENNISNDELMKSIIKNLPKK